MLHGLQTRCVQHDTEIAQLRTNNAVERLQLAETINSLEHALTQAHHATAVAAAKETMATAAALAVVDGAFVHLPADHRQNGAVSPHPALAELQAETRGRLQALETQTVQLLKQLQPRTAPLESSCCPHCVTLQAQLASAVGDKLRSRAQVELYAQAVLQKEASIVSVQATLADQNAEHNATLVDERQWRDLCTAMLVKMQDHWGAAARAPDKSFREDSTAADQGTSDGEAPNTAIQPCDCQAAVAHFRETAETSAAHFLTVTREQAQLVANLADQLTASRNDAALWRAEALQLQAQTTTSLAGIEKSHAATIQRMADTLKTSTTALLTTQQPSTDLSIPQQWSPLWPAIQTAISAAAVGNYRSPSC